MKVGGADLALRALTVADVQRLAEIHAAAFPASALTSLGGGAIRRYYRWLVTGPHDVNAIGAVLDGEVVGYVIGGRFRGAMIGFLRRNLPYLVLQTLVRPHLWRKARIRGRITSATRLLRRRPSSVVATGASLPVTRRAFGILVIAVDPSARRRGVGQQLMRASRAEALARGAVVMNLTVDPANRAALRFYEQLGWVASESAGSYAMELDLRT